MAVCEVLLPNVGGKPENFALVELRRLGGRQVMADDNARLLEVAKIGFLFQAQQVVQDARRYVAHITGALSQILVFDGRQGGGVALGDGVEGVFGVDLLLPDNAHHLVEQGAIFQDEQMGVEDAAFLRPHADADLALDFENLLAGLHERLLQAVDFLGQLGLSQLQLGNAGTGASQYEDLPAAYTGRDRNAPEAHFSLMLGLCWHG